MASYKITVWIDTDLSRDYIISELESMDFPNGVQYDIEEVTSA
jgi:hypothetical protein